MTQVTQLQAYGSELALNYCQFNCSRSTTCHLVLIHVIFICVHVFIGIYDLVTIGRSAVSVVTGMHVVSTLSVSRCATVACEKRVSCLFWRVNLSILAALYCHYRNPMRIPVIKVGNRKHYQQRRLVLRSPPVLT